MKSAGLPIPMRDANPEQELGTRARRRRGRATHAPFLFIESAWLGLALMIVC